MTKPNSYQKWKYTLYTSIIFIVVINPFTYKMLNTIVSPRFKIYGFILQYVIFTLIVRGVMELNI